MPPVTRTIGPLHFEDLEPKRFEDLIRQLVYDFRQWRQLETTGRAGSDDGFDARGFEIVPSDEPSLDNPEPEDADVLPISTGEKDRQWLIQCKRERTIGPTALVKHLNAIAPSEIDQLHGIIFAAACDFSKAAHDRLREWCAEHKIIECYLWGKGQIEDFLFQPKNDHLLFAYFGFSLAVRRRSIRTELRTRLAMKRKAERIFGRQHRFFKTALIRDPTDDRYPERPGKEALKRDPMRWRVVEAIGHDPRGLMLLARNHFAYIADDGLHWDFVEKADDGRYSQGIDPWSDKAQHDPERDKVWRFWFNLPEKNRAQYKVFWIAPYEDLLDIDESGDSAFEHPHIYSTALSNWDLYLMIEPAQRWAGHVSPDPANRIKFFPDVFPESEPDDPRKIE